MPYYLKKKIKPSIKIIQRTSNAKWGSFQVMWRINSSPLLSGWQDLWHVEWNSLKFFFNSNTKKVNLITSLDLISMPQFCKMHNHCINPTHILRLNFNLCKSHPRKDRPKAVLKLFWAEVGAESVVVILFSPFVSPASYCPNDAVHGS